MILAPTALSIQQLTKVYTNGTVALKNIDIDVKRNDFFGLLGVNGAGKSTMIGIICSLVRKTSGNVQIFGHNLEKALLQAKSLIGVVPQEINFSLFENISQILINQAGYYGVPKKIALERLEVYLKAMDLWEMRREPAFRLSGVMKRRLMIARALMNEPKLLVLDEPTAGVDIELRHGIWQFLKNLNQMGTTIILTTHYLEEAEELCKHVAIIDHGTIIEHANVKSLINRMRMQTLVLDLALPLESLPHIEDFQCALIDRLTIEVIISCSQSINDLFSLLTAAGISVSSMRNKTNRLEELFIHLITKQGKSSTIV